MRGKDLSFHSTVLIEARIRPHPRSPATGDHIVALSEIDRTLLDRCIAQKPRAWEDFVDRFGGLVVHVINHTARAKSLRLAPQDVEDLASQVFLELVKNQMAVLRHFRRQSSLATYLTVVARRVVVRELLQRKTHASLADAPVAKTAASQPPPEERIANQEEVQRLLEELDGAEADVVRMYHLEGKSYQEISAAVGMAENSIGPILSRAREKMRRASADSATS